MSNIGGQNVRTCWGLLVWMKLLFDSIFCKRFIPFSICDCKPVAVTQMESIPRRKEVGGVLPVLSTLSVDKDVWSFSSPFGVAASPAKAKGKNEFKECINCALSPDCFECACVNLMQLVDSMPCRACFYCHASITTIGGRCCQPRRIIPSNAERPSAAMVVLVDCRCHQCAIIRVCVIL